MRRDSTRGIENDVDANLRRYHHVTTLADLETVKGSRVEGCPRHEKCEARARLILREVLPKYDMSYPDVKDNLDHTERRLRFFGQAIKEDRDVCINPDITERGEIENATRVFAFEIDPIPAVRQPTDIAAEETTVYTDGSADRNGQTNSKCGAGLWSSNPN
ncbi:hypothetical protein M407DRAFT_87194, partial [Tulasnella calospora MUT 4182]